VVKMKARRRKEDKEPTKEVWGRRRGALSRTKKRKKTRERKE
jgi:hypothetical protein